MAPKKTHRRADLVFVVYDSALPILTSLLKGYRNDECA